MTALGRESWLACPPACLLWRSGSTTSHGEQDHCIGAAPEVARALPCYRVALSPSAALSALQAFLAGQGRRVPPAGQHGSGAGRQVGSSCGVSTERCSRRGGSGLATRRLKSPPWDAKWPWPCPAPSLASLDAANELRWPCSDLDRQGRLPSNWAHPGGSPGGF